MSANTLRGFFGILIATLIVLGFWFGPDIHRLWFEKAEPVNAPLPRNVMPAPAEIPSPLPVETAPLQSDTRKPVPRGVDTAATLARLAQSCAFWSARANDSSGKAFRDRACREMRGYAASTGQRVPSMDVRARVPQVRKELSRSSKRLAVEECTRHVHGSILYRQCRARESQRLKNICQDHRQRDEWQQVGEWCSAYENYRVVD